MAGKKEGERERGRLRSPLLPPPPLTLVSPPMLPKREEEEEMANVKT